MHAAHAMSSSRIQTAVQRSKQKARGFTDREAQPETTESPPEPSLRDDTSGQTSATRAVELIVALMVGGLVAAFLLPIAIEEIAGVETTEWSSGAAALWGILGTIIVLAAFLYFIGVALSSVDRI